MNGLLVLKDFTIVAMLSSLFLLQLKKSLVDGADIFDSALGNLLFAEVLITFTVLHK